jgi:hypothetical protein
LNNIPGGWALRRAQERVEKREREVKRGAPGVLDCELCIVRINAISVASAREWGCMPMWKKAEQHGEVRLDQQRVVSREQ